MTPDENDLAASINEHHAAAVQAFGGEQQLEDGLGALVAMLDRFGGGIAEAIVSDPQHFMETIDEMAGEFCLPSEKLVEMVEAMLTISLKDSSQ